MLRRLRPWMFLLALPLAAADVVPGRFLVELKGEPAAAVWRRENPRSDDFAARKAIVRGEQDRMTRLLAARKWKVTAAVDTVSNTVIVEAPGADASALRALPGVKRVEPVLRLSLRLDHATAVAAVPAAWEMLGGAAKAGEGIRIAILDTGIQSDHPGFNAPEMRPPDGFPQVSNDENRSFTNNKIIVARSYDQGQTDAMRTVLDQYGHGTAVAMTAAGMRADSPRGPITGVAPGAWLGVYRVNFRSSGGIMTDYVLQALDDAANDGMEVVNMSFGSLNTGRPEAGIFADAVQRMTDRGITVVNAAGNEGPEPITLEETASLPAVIAVGAQGNERVFTNPAVLIGERDPLSATPADNSDLYQPVTAEFVSIFPLDSTGLGCAPLPEGSLTGKIVLILRGTCFFEEKLNLAQQAGAAGAVVYSDGTRPSAMRMATGDATLPAIGLGYEDGETLRTLLAESKEPMRATLRFYEAAASPNRVEFFSSRGPTTTYGLKPDLIAVGGDFMTATQNNNPYSDMYAESGFTIVDGTSFSSPLVAGAAAVVRSARKGLSESEYRSLLINSAVTVPAEDGKPLPVMQTGAGALNVANALKGTVAASPVSLSFGVSGSTMDLSQDIDLKNLSDSTADWAIAIESADERKPAVSLETVSVASGATQRISVAFRGEDVPEGTYQGFVAVRSTASDVPARIAYWLAVPSKQAAKISVVDRRYYSSAGSSNSVLFRVLDASSVALEDPAPVVTVTEGNGSVDSVELAGPEMPGVWRAQVRLGGADSRQNKFKIAAGEVSTEIVIYGW